MQHLRDLKPAPRLAIPVILGVLFACGDQVAEGNGSLYGSMPALLAKMVLFAALFVVAFCAGERLIKFLANRMRRSDVSEGEKDSTSASTLIRYDSSVRNVLVNGCVIGICWLPYVFCFYPGVYWSDTSLQLLMHYGAKTFTDQVKQKALGQNVLTAVKPKAVLFLGKCGSLKSYIGLGAMLLPIAGIRGEGTSLDYFPEEVPALPAFNLEKAISATISVKPNVTARITYKNKNIPPPYFAAQ